MEKKKKKEKKKKRGKRFCTGEEGENRIRIARQKVKRIQFRREFGAGAVRSRSFCVFDRLRSGAYLMKRMKQKNLLIKVIKVCDII